MGDSVKQIHTRIYRALSRLGISQTDPDRESWKTDVLPEGVGYFVNGWHWAAVERHIFRHKLAAEVTELVGVSDETGDSIMLLDKVSLKPELPTDGDPSSWCKIVGYPAVAMGLILPVVLLLRCDLSDEEDPPVVAVNMFPEIGPEFPKLLELGPLTKFLRQLEIAPTPQYPPVPSVESFPQPDWDAVADELAEAIRRVVNYHSTEVPGERYRSLLIYDDGGGAFQVNLDTVDHFEKVCQLPDFSVKPGLFLNPEYYDYGTTYEEPYGIFDLWDTEEIYEQGVGKLTELCEGLDMKHREYRDALMQRIEELRKLQEQSKIFAALNSFRKVVEDGTLKRFEWSDDAIFCYAEHDAGPLVVLQQRVNGKWVEPVIPADCQKVLFGSCDAYLPPQRDRVPHLYSMSPEAKLAVAGLAEGDLPMGLEPWRVFYAEEIEAAKAAEAAHREPSRFSEMLDSLVAEHRLLSYPIRLMKRRDERKADQFAAQAAEQVRIAATYLTLKLPISERAAMLLDALAHGSLACGAVQVDGIYKNVMVSAHELSRLV